MNQLTGSMKGFHWGGFSAIFMTALLFTALPLLTQIKLPNPVPDDFQPVFIDTYKPALQIQTGDQGW